VLWKNLSLDGQVQDLARDQVGCDLQASKTCNSRLHRPCSVFLFGQLHVSSIRRVSIAPHHDYKLPPATLALNRLYMLSLFVNIFLQINQLVMTTLPNTQSQTETVDIANLLKRRCELLEELLAQGTQAKAVRTGERLHHNDF
jgi:hypothetical protein